jgi:uncharacterized protein (DUF885 family)
MLQQVPETATFLGVDVGERAVLRHRLTDRTPTGVDRLRTGCAQRLAQLRSINFDHLPESDTIDVRATLEAHALADEGYRNFDFGDNLLLTSGLTNASSPYAISQSSGFFANIPDFLDTQHKVETRDDADAYLDRLQAFARGLDGETERLRRDAGQGVVAPDFIVDALVDQRNAYADQPIAEWGLITSLAKRAAKANIAGEWSGRAQRICEQDVGPALARQTEQLKALRSSATSDGGVWKLKQGEAYYAWALKVGTTTSMTPDEVHKAGLEQVALLNRQMDDLFKTEGMTRGTVGERLAALSEDPKQLYPATASGREALIDYLNEVIHDVRSQMPRAFAARNKADLIIRQVPPTLEASAPLGYEVDGPIDGSRPAGYFINLHDMTNWPKFTLPTLCFHEGLPGHVWQGTYGRALPLIRSQFYFNAYVEGWALYAEQLADELGMYDHDPLGRLGYLQSLQFRACRLVVDTGLHVKRWSRAKAIQWLKDNNGLPADASRSEVDRYCTWPGQACGYFAGLLTLRRLRSLASNTMGDRFSLPRYHDAILRVGSVPLDELDAVIARYIASDAARSSHFTA